MGLSERNQEGRETNNGHGRTDTRREPEEGSGGRDSDFLGGGTKAGLVPGGLVPPTGPVQRASASLELFPGPKEGPGVKAASVDPEDLGPGRFWFGPGP